MTKVKTKKLVRLDVVTWNGAWCVKQGHTARSTHFSRQIDAVVWARDYANKLIMDGIYGVTVRIHRRDGRVREERTYPRSADPRRSRG